jgi:hypothetical protein
VNQNLRKAKYREFENVRIQVYTIVAVQKLKRLEASRLLEWPRYIHWFLLIWYMIYIKINII